MYAEVDGGSAREVRDPRQCEVAQRDDEIDDLRRRRHQVGHEPRVEREGQPEKHDELHLALDRRRARGQVAALRGAAALQEAREAAAKEGERRPAL